MGRDIGFILYAGNMFGGKTANMIFDLQRADFAGKSVQAFKISWDDRNEEGFLEANNGQLKYPASSVANIRELEKSLRYDTDILAIDEVQFWGDSIVDFIREESDNRLIIATGLQFDYRGNPFVLRDERGMRYDSKRYCVSDLMAISTDIRQRWPVCTHKNKVICGKDAYFPQRWRSDGSLSRNNDDTIVVGGEESYAPRCKKHWIKPE